MKKDEPLVSIILLNWNGKEDTIDCLESLKRVNYANFEVIVVDNNSTDGSVEQILKWAKVKKLSVYSYDKPSIIKKPFDITEGLQQFIILNLKENIGFCRGNNLGMEQAKLDGAKYFLILNNDTTVTENFLKPLVASAEADDKIGLVGGTILYYNKPDVIWWAGGAFTKRFPYYQYQYNGESLINSSLKGIKDTEWISGCMMLYRAKIFDKIGGFDEDLFIIGDEWDLSKRVFKEGCRIVVAYDSYIYHKVGKTLGIKNTKEKATNDDLLMRLITKIITKPSYITPIAYYYGTRNLMVFKKRYSKNMWEWYKFQIFYLFTRILRFSQLILSGYPKLAYSGFCAIWDFYNRKTGKWIHHDKRF